ncbi:MAG: hypothetical protein Q9211_000060 [Gyalolechia sp. 1 TL-2023]
MPHGGHTDIALLWRAREQREHDLYMAKYEAKINSLSQVQLSRLINRCRYFIPRLSDSPSNRRNQAVKKLCRWVVRELSDELTTAATRPRATRLPWAGCLSWAITGAIVLGGAYAVYKILGTARKARRQKILYARRSRQTYRDSKPDDSESDSENGTSEESDSENKTSEEFDSENETIQESGPEDGTAADSDSENPAAEEEQRGRERSLPLSPRSANRILDTIVSNLPPPSSPLAFTL